MRRALRAGASDKRGAAIVEFALVAPLFFLTLFGIMDFGMLYYGQHVLQGVVSQSARNSTLENYANDQAALDALVESRVRQVFSGAVLEFQRKAYESFDDVGMPERIQNDNGNGVREPSECFWDANGTGQWESDKARGGNGGADDVVLYQVTMNIDRIFPFWALIGQPQQTSLRAATVLRNQPYASQTATEVLICPT